MSLELREQYSSSEFEKCASEALRSDPSNVWRLGAVLACMDLLPDEPWRPLRLPLNAKFTLPTAISNLRELAER